MRNGLPISWSPRCLGLKNSIIIRVGRKISWRSGRISTHSGRTKGCDLYSSIICLIFDCSGAIVIIDPNEKNLIITQTEFNPALIRHP